VANKSRISKLLSLMLRHRPDEFGLEIDAYGFAPLEQVVQAVQERYKEVQKEDVVALVQDPEQRRFELTEQGIRALYGHSFFVEMDGEPMEPPPEHLYMGTTLDFARRAHQEGIVPKDRCYVHLSLSRQAAEGRSRQEGGPCVVEIKAAQAHAAGICFFARGEVVLAEEIPADFVGEIYGLENREREAGPEADPAYQPVARGQATYGRKPRYVSR
jgi:putative RNA 2'-phosphotransferase